MYSKYVHQTSKMADKPQPQEQLSSSSIVKGPDKHDNTTTEQYYCQLIMG